MTLQKSRLMFLMELLNRETDEEQRITIAEIIDRLKTEGLSANRHTIAGDLNTLIAHDIDVVCNKSRQNQYFIGDRHFELPELMMLVDAVQAEWQIGLRFIIASHISINHAVFVYITLYIGGLCMKVKVKRGEMYFAELSPSVGSEQNGYRPVLILQNAVGNLHSPTVVVAAISGKPKKMDMPTHYYLPAGNGLDIPSVVLLEQLRTIDKSRLGGRIGELQSHVQAITLDEVALLEKLKKQMNLDDSEQQNLLRQEAKKLTYRLSELTQITADLYEDKVTGKISEVTFTALMNKN